MKYCYKIGYEPGIIPDPGLPIASPQNEAEQVILPDDSLADTDLHDHDLIDSVMYIYFGSSSRTDGGAGKQVYQFPDKNKIIP